MNVNITGLGYSPKPDYFLLNLFVDPLDQRRGVTIPLRFSKVQAKECIDWMGRWLEQQGDET